MNRQHHRSTGPVHAATAIDSNRYCHQPEMEQRYQQQFQRHHHDSFDYYDQQQQAEAAAVAAAMMDDRRLFFSPAYFDPDLLRVTNEIQSCQLKIESCLFNFIFLAVTSTCCA